MSDDNQFRIVRRFWIMQYDVRRCSHSNFEMPTAVAAIETTYFVAPKYHFHSSAAAASIDVESHAESVDSYYVLTQMILRRQLVEY